MFNQDATVGTKAHFLKTKVCEFNLRGKCKRGEACKFAHSVADMAPLPDLHRTRLCSSMLKMGACPNGDSCKFAHSVDELRIFDGTCKPLTADSQRATIEQAFREAVSHPASDVPAFEGQEKTARRGRPLMKVDMCKFFQEGRCLRGNACTFAHEEGDLKPRPNLYRTSPCFKFWTFGKCSDDCKYSHSLETLRSKAGKSTSKEDDQLASGIWSRQTTLENDDEFGPIEPFSRMTSGDTTGTFSRQTSCETNDLLNVSPGAQDLNFNESSSEPELLRPVCPRAPVLCPAPSPTIIADMPEFFLPEAATSDCDLVLLGSVDGKNAEEDCGEEGSTSDDGLSHECASSDLTSTSSLSKSFEDGLTQQAVVSACARLQDVSGLHEIRINIKNTFLDFEETDREAFYGSAACRSRSV